MHSGSNLYLRIANELRKSTPNIEQILCQPQTPQEDQFNQFVLEHLGKYVVAHQCLQQIKTSLGNIMQRHYLTPSFSKLPQTIRMLTGDKELQTIFAGVIQMDKTLKQTKECQKVVKESQFHLKQLKYFKFEMHDNRLDLKAKRLVDVINIYQSFLVCTAAEKKGGKLEASSEIAHSFYKDNYYLTNGQQTNLMRKIEEQTNQYNQVLSTIQKFTQNFPSFRIIRQKYTVKQQVQNMYDNAVNATKQISCINQYLQLTVESLKQNKQIPSITRYTHSINSKTLNLFCQLKSKITRPNQQIVRNITPWLNPWNFFNNFSYIEDASFQELKEFVSKTYNKLYHSGGYVSMKQKMKCIDDRIGGNGYTSQIVEEVTNMQTILNEVIDKMLRYFKINKQQSHKPQIMYSFSLEDICRLNKAIQESPKLNFLEEKQLFNNHVPAHNREQRLYQAIEEITKLFEKLLKASEKGKMVFSTHLNQRIKQFDEIISTFAPKSIVFKTSEARNAQIFQQPEFQVLQIQKPVQKQSISAMEKSIDYKKQYRQNNISLQAKQASIRDLTEKNIKLQSELTQLKMSYYQVNQQQKNMILHFEAKCKEIERLKDLSKQQATIHTLKLFNQQISSLQQQNSALKHENQVYFQNKMDLQHELQAEQLKHKEGVDAVLAKHEIQIRDLKELYSDHSKSSLRQISQKYQVEKQQLLKEIQYLRHEYSDLQDKHYSQIQQKLSQSIINVSRKCSREQEDAQVNTSYIWQKQEIKQNKELDQILRLQKQSIKKYQDQIKVLNAKLQSLHSQLDSCKTQNQTLQKLKAIKEQQNVQLRLQSMNLQERNSNLQRQINFQLENAQTLRKTINQLEANIKTIYEQTARARESQRETRESLQLTEIPTNLPTMVHYTRCLFNQDIFYNNQEEKKRLVQHIQWYVRSKITRTQLLHKYDTRNKTNFHQYIDQVEGLAIVVKTKNAIIAGFYPGALRDKEILNKGGILVSVTNDQGYVLYNKKPGDNNKTIYRGMIYDTFFAIFGNAEIRVKSGFKTVFSNFGVSNGYYNSRGDKVDKFLNEGDKREVQFEYCEFYKISFQRGMANYR